MRFPMSSNSLSLGGGEEVVPSAQGSALCPLRPSSVSGLVENACLLGQGEFAGYSAGGLHRGKCISQISLRPSRGKAACFCAASLKGSYVPQRFLEQKRRKTSKILGLGRGQSCFLAGGNRGQLSWGSAKQQ